MQRGRLCLNRLLSILFSLLSFIFHIFQDVICNLRCACTIGTICRVNSSVYGLLFSQPSMYFSSQKQKYPSGWCWLGFVCHSHNGLVFWVRILGKILG